MFDQMSALSLPCYGQARVNAPSLQALADRGVLFENAYCNSPLCSPSRFAMQTGRLASRIGAYDNAAEFPASLPTLVHYLRTLGYRTCLSGKMDFTGADQLHGYEERTTTDLSPSDFGWTPTWDEPTKIHAWFHNLLSVVEAGPCERSLAIDYDEEACFQAVRWLYDAARGNDERPFMLTVSFMHPHDPYLAPRPYWDLYRDDDIDPPAVAYVPPAERDPHSRRLYNLYDRDEYRVTDAHVRAARRGYYGMISYIDAKLGELLAALRQTGLADDTIVAVTADHGDMLGERGLWYKMTFFERAVRVPLILQVPHRFTARRVAENVSLVDVLPTLLDFANDGRRPEMIAPIDGNSLVPLASGSAAGWPDTVFAEYMAEGTEQPLFMIRRGRYKYVCGEGDPPQLYDLAADPHEGVNLAPAPAHGARAAAFAAEAAARWDSTALRRQIVESQRQRLFTHAALIKGRIAPWDYQPRQDASRQYNRNYSSELYDTDRRARLPNAPEPPRERS